MANKLEISSDLAADLPSVAEGDQITLEITGTVASSGDGGLVVDVESVQPDDEASEGQEPDGDESGGAAESQSYPKAVKGMMGGGGGGEGA